MDANYRRAATWLTVWCCALALLVLGELMMRSYDSVFQFIADFFGTMILPVAVATCIGPIRRGARIGIGLSVVGVFTLLHIIGAVFGLLKAGPAHIELEWYFLSGTLLLVQGFTLRALMRARNHKGAVSDVFE